MLPIVSTPDSIVPARLSWTKQACEYLESGGLLTPGKYELIQGEIIPKMPQKLPHMRVTTLLILYLAATFGEKNAYTQGTLSLSASSAAEPDGFAPNNTSNTSNNNSVPVATDVILVAEVSDTTLRFDLAVKATLYAEAMIPEYWVIDIENRTIHVHQDPKDSLYQSITAVSENTTIAPLHAPNSPILVRNLLP